MISQEDLNKVRMDDWDYKNIYQQAFRLPLTSKHMLAVGSWSYGGDTGVDLRKYSYAENRLLGAGLTIKTTTWLKIFEVIVEMKNAGMFLSHEDEDDYCREIVTQDGFEIKTSIFKSVRDWYLCINLYKNGKPVGYSFTAKGIMIKFNTINDFIENCYSHNLVQADKKVRITVSKGETDSRTGRETF